MSGNEVIRFDGETYVAARDRERLAAQIDRVRTLMLDGKWRSLDEIAASTKDPTASVSARLRDLRKERFGGNTVNRQYVTRGLFQYQVLRPGCLF